MNQSIFLLLFILGFGGVAYLMTPLVYCERRSRFFSNSILAYIQPNYGIKAGITFEYRDILEFKLEIPRGVIWISINKGKFEGRYWIGSYTPDELNKIRGILLSKGVYETLNEN